MNRSPVRCVAARSDVDLVCLGERGQQIVIPAKETDPLIRAYAATVHDAQGCEALASSGYSTAVPTAGSSTPDSSTPPSRERGARASSSTPPPRR